MISWLSDMGSAFVVVYLGILAAMIAAAIRHVARWESENSPAPVHGDESAPFFAAQAPQIAPGVAARSQTADLARRALIICWFFLMPLGLIAGILLEPALPPPSMLGIEIILLGILSWSYSAYRVLDDLLQVAEVRGLDVRGYRQLLLRAGTGMHRGFVTLFAATLGLALLDGMLVGVPAMVDLLSTTEYGFAAVYIGIVGAMLAAGSWVYMQAGRSR